MVVSDRVKGHGEPGFGLRFSRGGGSPLSGAGAYLRHAVMAGVMKPCGHDQRELTQICRPHRWWVMPVFELPAGRDPIYAASGGSGCRRHAARNRRVSQPSGGGDAADVATAASADTSFDRGNLGVTERGRQLHRRPAQQPGALLADPATRDVTVGLAVARLNPAHEHTVERSRSRPRRRSRRRTRRRARG